MQSLPFAPVFKPRATAATLLVAAAVLIALAALTSLSVHAAPPGTPTTAPLTGNSAAKPGTRAASSPKAVQVETKPLWTELTPAQQQTLAPLAATWSRISEAQKRKWLVIARNYPSLPAAEQARINSRMTEWVGLSAQQRTQARLNFAETKQLPSDDKKAKWEAYKALPPDEKRKLAAGAAATVKPPSTAAAIKPVPAQKLVNVPKAPDSKPAPRIAAAPAPAAADHNPPLPQPGALPAPPAPALAPVSN